MDDGGKTSPDFDQPTRAGTSGPQSRPLRNAGLGAQTPPPVSDAATLLDVTPVPRSSSYPRPVSDSGLNAQAILLPNTLLAGRYLILRVLGEGGMGAVYQARDQELDRLIAVKVIRPELASNPSILQRFKQELILSRNVTHKNVVRIFDLGEAEGIKFITMEYVEGEDLRTLLRDHGKYSPSDAVEIIQQICRALDAAHSEGVIHRDLKPQNVMRDPQGRIVVMDFGLARSLEQPGMTQTGALVGTLEYMSPEQAMGGDLDQRSDLFAVGLIFFELLTGKVPYKAETAIASLMKRTQERAVPVSDVDKAVPKALCIIVSRCLERDPKQRFNSALELTQYLESWKGNPAATATMLERMAPISAPRSVQISLNLPGNRTWMWLAAIAAIFIAFFAIPATRHLVLPPLTQTVATTAEGIPELSKGKFVAVLPLKVMGDEKSLRYMADGLVDALSAKMFQLQEVHVASSSAVEKVATSDQSLAKIARALGVNLILQGTVQGNADKMRITLNLEDMSGGRRLWSQEYSGVPQDLLTIEDQIYGNLVSALELKPSNEELARSGVHPTENSAAYDLYLKGRDALRGNQGARDTQTAVKLLSSALQQDPNFALAYTGLADANLRLYKETRDPIFTEKALNAAQKAAGLSPAIAEVHLSLGSVFNATGRNSEAITELKQALKLAPNSDEAYRRLGDAYMDGGRQQEAIAAYQDAVKANPYYWGNHKSLGNAYFNLGENDKALQEYQRVTEISPDNSSGYEAVASVYLRQRRWDQAIPAFQKSIEIEPVATAYSNLGTAYFYAKRYDEAVKVFEKASQLSPKDETVIGNLADAYRSSGKTYQANSNYDRAIKLAYQQLQVNPRSASTMGDLALYYAKKGDAAHAEQYIKQARSLDAGDVQLAINQAIIYALSDKKPEAMAALKDALQKGYGTEEALNEPELAKLQGLPEFSKLIKQHSKQN